MTTWKRLLRFSLTLTLAAPLAAASALFADSARAQDGLVDPPERICRPIQTCRIDGPIPLDPSSAIGGAPTYEPRPCPEGYECTCVPSCPICADCAAQVCVPAPRPQCRTACDCDPGLGCFNGRCIAGFAPVYCCEGDTCPAGQQCQHRDGEMDRCHPICEDTYWSCENPGNRDEACGDDRVCSCSAACPSCENCGPGVCVPPGSPTPYECGDDGRCAEGDQCVCVSSCPECDDCVQAVCVPERCDDPMCRARVEKVTKYIEHWTQAANRCFADEQCVRLNTSTECRGTCGAWVNRLFAPSLKRAIHALDRRVCSTYIEDGCPFATPGCLLEVGRCVENRCVGRPVRPDPGPLDFVPGHAVPFADIEAR